MQGKKESPAAGSAAGEMDARRWTALARAAGQRQARQEGADETLVEDSIMAALESLIEEISSGDRQSEWDEAWIVVHAQRDVQDYLKHERMRARHEVSWSAVRETTPVMAHGHALSPEAMVLRAEVWRRLQEVAGFAPPEDWALVLNKHVDEETIKISCCGPGHKCGCGEAAASPRPAVAARPHGTG